jgi:hypothetical protein
MEKGIIPIPLSGLGNQMFIVIAGFIASLHNNCPLYLYDNTNSGNWHSKKEYKNNIFKFIGIHRGGCFLSHMNTEYVKHNMDLFLSFEPWTVESVKPGMYLNAYYQYYPPFEPYENIIREKLLLGLELFRDKLKKKYDFDKCAFLHVRRGDYLHFADRHYIQPISYYRFCIQELLKLKENIKKIYILSDDNEWIKNCSLFNYEYKNICEVYENEDEIESLAFMSLCNEGAICTNSTFSWWGAYLGAFEKRNPVFVPKKWMKTTSEIKIWPKQWIIIAEKNFI